MNPNENAQKWMDQLLANPAVTGKKLLLHSCCAPCSSYVLMYLSRFFEITVFYYNPNITIEPEYEKRVLEQKRLIRIYNDKKIGMYPIHVMEGAYEPALFFDTVRGLEQCVEGKERCFLCYHMRLQESALVAKQGRFDYFATTLTISPLKNAKKINEIGLALSEEYGVPYLCSDFKKKNGYLTSIRLSEEYDLYRQDYCGCVYSKAQRDRKKQKCNKKIEGEQE